MRLDGVWYDYLNCSAKPNCPVRIINYGKLTFRNTDLVALLYSHHFIMSDPVGNLVDHYFE